MPQHSVTVRCQVPSSFAVDQVRGMFDLQPAAEAVEQFDVELPAEDEDWQIGVVVGPSGSGKSTVAREVYGEAFVEGCEWDPHRAVIDHFGDLDIRQVTGTLNAVGFSSPPSWVKPHQVLSGGERFRCDLARALLAPGDLVAFDEFTSVVDRTVAKIGSAAVAKNIRKGRLAKKFVAVTCHYDVLDWLEPDWVLDMASGQLARGCLYRRPAIELEVAPVHRSAWKLFRRHHYLNHDIATSAKCFAAFWGSEPVAFTSWIHRMTRKRRAHDMREHRTVVLPDFQGIGIGNRLSEIGASVFVGVGGRVFSTTSPPGMIHYRNQSDKWRTKRFGMAAATGGSGLLQRTSGRPLPGLEKARLTSHIKNGKRPLDSAGRVTGGFQYVGPSMDPDQARSWLAGTPHIFGDDECDAILATLDPDTWRTASSVAARSGIPRSQVEAALKRLAKTGQVAADRLGTRLGYQLAEISETR